MDPIIFTVATLKEVTRICGVTVYGTKAEIIRRLHVFDPSGAWIQKTSDIHNDPNREINIERESEETDENQLGDKSPSLLDRHDETAGSTGTGLHQTQQTNIPPLTMNTRDREMELIRRERDLLERELRITRRELDLQRAGTPALSVMSHTSH